MVNVLHCALKQCMIIGSDDHHQWNGQLLDDLIHRYIQCRRHSSTEIEFKYI